MRLKKAQREILLTWIAEGLTSDEVNSRAAIFDPPFNVSRQQVDHYRKTRKVEIEEIKQRDEFSALKSGLAKKEERLYLLKQLADHLAKDLFERSLFWTDMVKGIGRGENYERVEYEEFNANEVAQLRGILDDIAKEVGDRKNSIDVTTKGEKINGDSKDRDRALSALADAIGAIIPGESTVQVSDMGAAEQTTMASSADQSG